MVNDTPSGPRAWWHRQLDVRAWPRAGVSPVNAIVIALIILGLTADVIATEQSFVDAWPMTFETVQNTVLAAFTLEYLLRLWSCGEDPKFAGFVGRLRYVVTPFALIDLVAILPGYLAWLGLSMTWLRSLRLLRIVKFARFGAFSLALDTLIDVARNRAYELVVSVALMVALILASAAGIYIVEGDAQPEAFGSIPRSMWWAVATLTTVGYGDVTPESPLGRTLAAFVSLSGIALVAVPTGILAASFSEVVQRRKDRSRDP